MEEGTSVNEFEKNLEKKYFLKYFSGFYVLWAVLVFLLYKSATINHPNLIDNRLLFLASITSTSVVLIAVIKYFVSQYNSVVTQHNMQKLFKETATEAEHRVMFKIDDPTLTLDQNHVLIGLLGVKKSCLLGAAGEEHRVLWYERKEDVDFGTIMPAPPYEIRGPDPRSDKPVIVLRIFGEFYEFTQIPEPVTTVDSTSETET